MFALSIIKAIINEYILGFFWYERKPIRTSFLNCKTLFTHFSVNKWVQFPIINSILSRILPRPKIIYERVIIPFIDNVNCCLDIANPDANINYLKGTILFCPGFSGSVKSSYCNWFTDLATKRGYRVIIYNRRAHVPESYSDIYPLHYEPVDLEVVLKWIHTKYPDSKLYGVGVSAGGNLLMRHAHVSSIKFEKIVSLCNGYNIKNIVYHVETKSFVNKLLMGFIREILENVKGARGIGRFYEKFSELENKILKTYCSSQTFLWDYYSYSSCSNHIKYLDMPVLCINTLDDPMIPYNEEYYINMIKENPNISVILTSHGGHVGYIDREWKCNWWCENALNFVGA